MFPSRILIAKLPQTRQCCHDHQPEMGIALTMLARACLCCLCPAHGWVLWVALWLLPCGVCTHLCTGMPWGWDDFSSSERIGLARHLLIPGEHAVCQGMVVMAGDVVWAVLGPASSKGITLQRS